MSLLGSILLDPNVIADVVQVINSDADFFKPAWHLYSAAVQIYEEHSVVDINLLMQRTQDNNTLEAVGVWITSCTSRTPCPPPPTRCTMRDWSTVIRQLIEAAHILQDAYDRDQSTDVQEAEQRIFRIAQRMESQRAMRLRDLIATTMQRIRNAMAARSRGWARTSVKWIG